MIRAARFASITGVGLAASSFLGLAARYVPYLGQGLWIVFFLLIVSVTMSIIVGNVLDNHFGWEQDTCLAISIGILAGFIVGGTIGWIILA